MRSSWLAWWTRTSSTKTPSCSSSPPPRTAPRNCCTTWGRSWSTDRPPPSPPKSLPPTSSPQSHLCLSVSPVLLWLGWWVCTSPSATLGFLGFLPYTKFWERENKQILSLLFDPPPPPPFKWAVEHVSFFCFVWVFSGLFFPVLVRVSSCLYYY